MTVHDLWEECPAGLVAKMAGELRARRLRARLRPALVAVAVLLVLGGAWGLQTFTGSAKNPLNCAQTMPLMADYHDGALGPQVTARVAEHLANCPACRKHYQDQFPGDARLDEVHDELVGGQVRARLLAAR